MTEGFEYTGDIHLGERPVENQPGVITVDENGEIIGDTSRIPEHILAQLQSPETQASIKAMYEKRHGNPNYPREPLPEPKVITKPGNTRNLATERKELSRTEFRRLSRKFAKKFRAWSARKIEQERGNITCP